MGRYVSTSHIKKKHGSRLSIIVEVVLEMTFLITVHAELLYQQLFYQHFYDYIARCFMKHFFIILNVSV